ncbi:MAG: Qat anti-phage system QueC-like protein QatC [Pyrinomonadaceae bacterium]
MNVDVELDNKKRRSDGLALVSIRISDLDASKELDISFSGLYERCRIPNPICLDLLIVASICYAIDKSVPRSMSLDSWTREFEVEIPVSSPTRWNAAAKELMPALRFLTGDNWNLSFKQLTDDLFVEPVRGPRQKPRPEKLADITAICSLSGGVDSLAGAINLLENDPTSQIHFIGHYDGSGTKAPQKSIFPKLQLAYPGRTEFTQVRIQQRPNKSQEMTLRSRSFLFAAIQVFAAQAIDNHIPIHMPENGFIALNLPLTPSRVGSCSTRTMHPYYLNKLQRGLRELGIRNSILNMFEFKTKGECVSACSNRNLIESAVIDSVSCSHGSRKQNWTRKGRHVRNCGYCVPCIIRRASMNKIERDNSLNYGIDILSDEIAENGNSASANDLRAIRSFVGKSWTIENVTREINRVASVSDVNKRANMILRGVEEIKALLESKLR